MIRMLQNQFLQCRCQTAVTVETGNILGDNDQFLLFQTDGNSSLQCLVRGLISDDNLEQLHLWHG